MIKIIVLLLFFILSFSVNSIREFDKYSLLKLFPNKYVPTVEMYDKNTDLELINYPVIFKTNKCSFFGKDVQKINNSFEAGEYINQFHYDKNDIIFQGFSPFTNEIGVFMKRNIVTNKLEVFSAVVRDLGSSSLVNNDCPKDKCFIITDKLSNIFKNKIIEISDRVIGFNWGRYDIKYESINELNQGNFHILELNIGPGPLPIIFPINFDIPVLWNNNDFKVIYKIIEVIVSYYMICLNNILSGKSNLNDIFRNIEKWINNINCILSE